MPNKNMRREYGLGGAILASVVVLSMFTAAPVQSQTSGGAGQEGGSARLNLAGKLRLATQEIAALSCEAFYGKSIESYIKLAGATDDFSRMLNGLANGDLALSIKSPEKNASVLRQIENIRKSWEVVELDVKVVASGTAEEVKIDQIMNADPVLLDQADSLLAVMSGVYSSRENFPRGAVMAVNIAARQNLLLQQIAKNDCLLRSGNAAFASRSADLKNDIELFNTSMGALQTGAPAAGLMEPPNDKVKSELKAADTQWQTVRSELENSSSGKPFINRAETQLLIKELKNAEVLYLLATSAQPDFYRIPLQVYAREELSRWLLEPQIVLSIRDQNTKHSNLTQADIDAMDQAWRAEAKSGNHQLIAELMGRPLSQVLKSYQNLTSGFVTEVFVMDNKGLNVGQSEITSDLWQGDEDKWQLTYADEAAEMHISEVEFDDSTGFYQSQVSLPINDPISGKRIGAVTFGVNVQSLL